MTNKSHNQWVSLGDLSLVTCLPVPDTCGPEGASLSVWLKIEDCDENKDGFISSLSVGSTGFSCRCKNGNMRYFSNKRKGCYLIMVNSNGSLTGIVWSVERLSFLML